MLAMLYMGNKCARLCSYFIGAACILLYLYEYPCSIYLATSNFDLPRDTLEFFFDLLLDIRYLCQCMNEHMSPTTQLCVLEMK